MVRDYGVRLGVKGAFNKILAKKGLKMCWSCGVVHGVDRYSPDNSKPDNLTGTCKSCRRRVRRAYSAANSAVERLRNVLWRETHTSPPPDKEKAKARRLLRAAKGSGAIDLPYQCADCATAELPLEGHHEDYTQPLDVAWLCRSCHMRRHRLADE